MAALLLGLDRFKVKNDSIGVALYPRDGGDGETLLKHADLALYAAKQQGRNRYRLYRPAGP